MASQSFIYGRTRSSNSSAVVHFLPSNSRHITSSFHSNHPPVTIAKVRPWTLCGEVHITNVSSVRPPLVDSFQNKLRLVNRPVHVILLRQIRLARLFRNSAHYVTGTLLALWSTGVVILLYRQDIPSIGALGTAALLLLSAAYTLAVASRAAKRLLESPANLSSGNR